MKEVLDLPDTSYEALTGKISGIAGMTARLIIPIKEATALLLLGSHFDGLPETEDDARVLDPKLLMSRYEDVKAMAPRAATLIGLLSPDPKYMSRVDGEVKVSLILGDIFTVDGKPGFAELFLDYAGDDVLVASPDSEELVADLVARTPTPAETMEEIVGSFEQGY